MSIKVTDRRMFTEDGELREGYDPGDDSDEPEAPPRPATPLRDEARPDAETARAGAARPAASGATAGASQPTPGGRPQVDTGESRHPAAQFLEIVGSLVEPATLFLGDAKMPDGESVEDLERARVYIDLLAVLQEKTAGNLDPEEESVLGEILYRLRMRYVQKKKGGR